MKGIFAEAKTLMLIVRLLKRFVAISGHKGDSGSKNKKKIKKKTEKKKKFINQKNKQTEMAASFFLYPPFIKSSSIRLRFLLFSIFLDKFFS